MEKPEEVRVKKYSKGYAVELKYGLLWKNLHSELYLFPDRYYFETEKEAKHVKSKIEKII